MSREDDAEPQSEGELLQWAKQTQRNIEFIVNQQAQFSADLQRVQEQNEERRARTDNIVERLATATLRRFEGVDGDISNLERKMEALVDSHIRLADTQKEADERLNAFIATVERIISERRNGGERGEEKSG